MTAEGVTGREQLEGETIDDRVAQEVPDPTAEAELADTEPLEMDATADETSPSPVTTGPTVALRLHWSAAVAVPVRPTVEGELRCQRGRVRPLHGR